MIQSAGKKDLSKLQLGSEQEERRLCTGAQGEATWRLSRGTQARSGFLGIFIPSFFLFHHLSNPLLSHAHGAAAWELQGATEAAAFPHSPVCPCRESRQGNTHSPSGSPHRTEARISCTGLKPTFQTPHLWHSGSFWARGSDQRAAGPPRSHGWGAGEIPADGNLVSADAHLQLPTFIFWGFFEAGLPLSSPIYTLPTLGAWTA